MPGAIRIKGLADIQRDFREFEAGLPQFNFRFLEIIGKSALQL